MRAAAAVADIVQLHPLTGHVPHAVHSHLLQAKTSHLKTARLLSNQHVLLVPQNITLALCNTLISPGGRWRATQPA